MRHMASYDIMETMRNTNQWMGATAKSFASYPALAMVPNPFVQWMAAYGEVTERSFERMVVKPDWGLDLIHQDGRDHVVNVKTVIERPFGDLIHFEVAEREAAPRKRYVGGADVGALRNLLRKTVKSLIPDCEVYVTDWHNARDIPVSAANSTLRIIPDTQWIS